MQNSPVMAEQKNLVHEAYMQRYSLSAADFPAWLQAALRLFKQDLAAADGVLTPELQAQANELADDIREWHEEEDEEPAPVPEPKPVPQVVPDPLTPEQVLMELHGQGQTKVTAAQLKAAGFRANPGASGGTWGKYSLAKALFGSVYTLTKK